ncbi:MAG: hypothetical protein KIT83_17785 [Bryobacterales bacterium]|nr:hypothetical protein [Bryobacterales bacterium]
MASPASSPRQGDVLVHVFDGARSPFPAAQRSVLYHLRDPFGTFAHRTFSKESSLRFAGVAARSGARSTYSVIVSARGYRQAGWFPIHVKRDATEEFHLMLLPTRGQLNFNRSTWSALGSSDPALRDLLTRTASRASAARNLYGELLESRPTALGCFLNVWEILRGLPFSSGNPGTYMHAALSFEKSDLQPDRCFLWCRKDFIDEVKQAAVQGIFMEVGAAGLFHPGASLGFKEKRFGQANLQICFHERDTRSEGGVVYVKTEFDVDYFRDPLSHFLLEVAVNSITGSVTDPRQVYCLRWMTSKRTAGEVFDPLFTVVSG